MTSSTQRKMLVRKSAWVTAWCDPKIVFVVAQARPTLSLQFSSFRNNLVCDISTHWWTILAEENCQKKVVSNLLSKLYHCMHQKVLLQVLNTLTLCSIYNIQCDMRSLRHKNNVYNYTRLERTTNNSQQCSLSLMRLKISKEHKRILSRFYITKNDIKSASCYIKVSRKRFHGEKNHFMETCFYSFLIKIC